MSENQIKKNIVINAPIKTVWPYVSTAEGMSAWFMPSDMEPIEGKEFTLQAGPWGESPCRVTEVESPNRFSFDWGKDWQVHFHLWEVDGKTELTFIHAGWEDGKQTEFGESHDVVRPRMSGGWDGLLEKLKKVIESDN
ncbi:SRPBCC family protein [Sporosarcina highlanderae]|uniref:SRPBCC domain-containing protein n=1 Tax=Sporosarcina highlanderae TaxID=3035916 RepID=A0ABT8JP79_9BACL|nr:SRPBCC domain-containing protein [Sporosarcina highlanderae]MDN4606227.1 SRPBCC domain-containing protein [Sporosarcina highlanderae]